MEIRGKTEEIMRNSIEAKTRVSSRTIRLRSFVATSTRIHESSRYRRVGARKRAQSPFHFARLLAERYWPAGRVVLQLSVATAVMTHNESVALVISGLAMMAEIAQDRLQWPPDAKTAISSRSN